MLDVSPTTLSNGWTLNLSHTSVEMPQWAIGQMLELVDRWSPIFPRGETWVGRELGVPSLFIRFDCILRDGRVHVCEIEERPCGVGVNREINRSFRERFDALRSEWPAFGWVASPDRVTDD